jgi:hypothetical protein
MYIATIPNRSSPPAVLLRESYRQEGQVKNRTLANLSSLPGEQIELLRRVLRGEELVSPEDAFDIERSLPHGHVAAVLGTVRRVGLEHLLARKRCRERDRVVAMIVARVLDPLSKLATARGLDAQTASSSLADVLELGSASADELYAALDWLQARQGKIEQQLSQKHLLNGTLVLYDVTSTYFEGRRCPLAKYGYNRDGKRDKLQIVFGLLCNAEGCPVAVEVFEGNTADPKTVARQICKLRDRFDLKRVILVGDRGMLTDARIREDLAPLEGLEWITALRAPAIRQLAEAGAIQRSLFDQRDLAEITDPAYPGERLIACCNPLLADERGRKRQELLLASEQELDKIVKATSRQRSPLRGTAKIALRVGRVLGRRKMAKHFHLEITDNSFRYERNESSIAAEVALDGIYVIRTNVPAQTMPAEQTVRSYKLLSDVERGFRCLKLTDINVRPIYHHLADRVRAHVFLCMLAYYVEWHLRRDLAPLLFDDDDRAAAEAQRPSVVQPAERSPRAQRKAQQQRTDDGWPVHSFRTLLADLATLAKNRVRMKFQGALPFDKYTTPTPLQQRVFALLTVSYNM